MSIEQYKTDDGYEYDDCHFDDAESLVITGILGFCGCGSPDIVGTLIMEAMQHCRDYHANTLTWQERDAKYPSEQWRYFMAYFLDEKGLTEHGTSVNSAWLTDHGKEVLGYLEEIYTETK